MALASETLGGTFVRQLAPESRHRDGPVDRAAWLVAGTLVLLCGCGRSDLEPEATPTPSTPLPPEIAAIDGALGPGMELPAIRAEGWVNGQSLSNEDLLGSVAVVDVWAYW